ncbi:DUF5615 family PIN-like protein [Halolamina salifodinae]|uniref:Putative nuclease of putative toxin-antitoxin system n=1 Tax=Halolamina salifodinae TaxID=1202767 RepID=A0A8T4H5H7_9EURY|nr:DUF5615 family PIN-like protein [Halolamina salifodinae]MBP1988378.1 putative nuclease of putative toxin-antitoxin system [Halolamina salifodinae]
MSGREWTFLLDENMEPQVESFLASEGYDAEHVQDALSKGARDKPDVLPYARETDRIVITSDVQDFAGLDPSEHPGLMLLYEQRVSAYEVANAVLDIVEAYGDRGPFVAEPLDEWM